MRPASVLRRSTFLIGFLLLGTSLSGGCGRGDLGQVSGTVTLDGQPLPDALVEFIPVDGEGGIAMGRTDGSGNYYTMLSRTVEGANVGEHKVRITTRDILDDGSGERWVPEKVPTKYNVDTELLTNVEAGSNTVNFDLSSEGGTIARPVASRSGQ